MDQAAEGLALCALLAATEKLAELRVERRGFQEGPRSALTFQVSTAVTLAFHVKTGRAV